MPRALLFLLSFLCTAGPALAASLTSDTLNSTAGFYQLKWEASQPVRLVESRSGDFNDSRVIYAGADTARVMSGKPDGEWHYRLYSTDSGMPVTETLTVVVQHHSLQRAWFFFGLGGLVFASTLVLILIGQRRAAKAASRTA